MIGRCQSVIWNNITSSPLSLTYGVPQGSILGPLLFLVMVADLPDYIIPKNCRITPLCPTVKNGNSERILKDDGLVKVLQMILRQMSFLLLMITQSMPLQSVKQLSAKNWKEFLVACYSTVKKLVSL